MLTRAEARLVAALAHRKQRASQGLFVAEGVRAVEDLLASPLSVRFVVGASSSGDGRGVDALRAAAARRKAAFHEVPERDFARMAATETPQGVLAVAEIPARALGDLSLAGEPAVVLVLDAVQDPGNLGTLARTAEALGAAGVVTLPGTVDPWNGKAVRAAMGSTFRLPVVAADWDELGPWLRGAGAAVLVADARGEPLPDPPPPRCALVLGNEGAGVSDGTLAHADRTVGIPLRGRAESLNVAAAGAILLHRLLQVGSG